MRELDQFIGAFLDQNKKVGETHPGLGKDESVPLVENHRTQYNVLEDLVWKRLSLVRDRITAGNLLERRKGTMQQHSSEESALDIQMENCIQDCLNSHTVCLDTAMSVLQKGNEFADAVRTMLDCSELCATTAHFMIRNSPLYGYVCQACADVCTHCAEVCAEIGENDCANACSASATSCQQLVKMLG